MNTFRAFGSMLVSLAAAVGMGQKVSLRFHPPVGKSYTYISKLDSQQNFGKMDMSMKMTSTITMKILSRSAAGTTMQTSISNVQVTAPKGSPMAAQSGMLKKMISGKPTTAVVDSRFRPVKMSGGPVPQFSQALAGVMGGGSIFPEGPVGPGSTWSTQVDMGKMGAAMPGVGAGGKIPVRLTLKRIVRRANGTFAEIEMTMIGDVTINAGAQGPVKTHVNAISTTIVDVATGMISDMSMKNMTDFQMMGQSLHMVQTTTMRIQ